MMTDAEVADQIDRADRFIDDFREMVATTAVDPASVARTVPRGLTSSYRGTNLVRLWVAVVRATIANR